MDHEAVIAQTRRWFEHVVLGLNLCPFAGAPYRAGRIRFTATTACSEPELSGAFEQALDQLSQARADEIETLLLVHPRVLTDFTDYNQYLDTADTLIDSAGLNGVIQVASFHPDYCFAGSAANDPANFSNRSPYPMLHLLREQSISAVIDAGADTEAVVARNIERLRAMSAEDRRRYFAQPASTGGRRDSPDRREPGQCDQNNNRGRGQPE